MLPRQVLPRQFYLVTRRCSQRQFLLRPDPSTNNAFVYCLIDAASRCDIDVLLPCAMSNHYHAVIYDRDGRYPEFIEQLHKLLARGQNALRGRWENFWSSEQTCVVKLIDREAVMDKLVYTATNPVLDDLVDRVHHWPGVNGLVTLLAGRPLRATRPRHFFRPKGPMPDALELPLTIPPELGPAAEVLSELRERVRAVEIERTAERLRTGRTVVGRRAVLAQSWRSHPTSREPRRNVRPQGRRARQVGADRGAAAQSRFCCRVRRCPHTLARWCSRGVPAGYLLAPTVCVSVSVRSVTNLSAHSNADQPLFESCGDVISRPLIANVSACSMRCSSCVSRATGSIL
jgi:REP element-mobilizing transposase RayT